MTLIRKLENIQWLACRNCILIYQGKKESWRTPQALCAVIDIKLLQSKYSLHECKRATERKQPGERQGPWKIRLSGNCLASIEAIDRVASIWLPKRWALWGYCSQADAGDSFFSICIRLTTICLSLSDTKANFETWSNRCRFVAFKLFYWMRVCLPALSDEMKEIFSILLRCLSMVNRVWLLFHSSLALQIEGGLARQNLFDGGGGDLCWLHYWRQAFKGKGGESWEEELMNIRFEFIAPQFCLFSLVCYPQEIACAGSTKENVTPMPQPLPRIAPELVDPRWVI